MKMVNGQLVPLAPEDVEQQIRDQKSHDDTRQKEWDKQDRIQAKVDALDNDPLFGNLMALLREKELV